MRTHTIRRLPLAAAALLATALPAHAQQPKREAPPALGTPKAFTLPPKREFTLANGLKVTFVPFGTIPQVSVYTMGGTAQLDEASSQVALSDVTGEMMREGTTARTATQI